MNRFLLQVVTVASTVILTGCGSNEEGGPTDNKSPDQVSVPTQTGETAPVELKPDRFSVAFADTAKVFLAMSNLPEGEQPLDEEDANTLAGLTSESPLTFSDYTITSDTTGTYCLEHLEGTYVAYTFNNDAATVLLGDGECSYEATTAQVIGDVTKNRWTKGATLMSTTQPNYLFGA